MVELAGDVDPLRDQLVEIYREAFCGPPYDETEADVAHFRAEKLPEHLGRADFRCAVARDGVEVVGFSYGYTGERGQPWVEATAEALGPTLARE